MHVQPRYNPYDPTDFFGDGQSARLPVAGTVPRGELTLGPQELLYTGKVNGQPAEAFPYPVTQEIVDAAASGTTCSARRATDSRATATG